ncbi:thiolase family protein [Vibrio sp. Of7-15]|uniref:thiolase family protein n=1 Tax=Vibrio sp. Of7-15 TaxID=2724879 RepID=UPI001EF3431D|nr:thiolase family protein [Vibrio sp. Of7-15]MCG7495629.1 thiolase family protein [Vibrio sp. Of7-15]
MNRVVITSCVRTPIGLFGKSLKTVSAIDLGAAVIEESLKRSNLSGKEVSEVLFGCAIQSGLGQNVARQCAIKAGLPEYVPATTVNQVCGSGLRSVSLAYQLIKSGDSDIILAGGTENMSQAPLTLKNTRFSGQQNNIETIDEIQSALSDGLQGFKMGMTAENLADKFKISREKQDQLAFLSHIKAKRAQDEGLLSAEICPILINKESNTYLSNDETIVRNVTPEHFSGLTPLFKDGGSVTAGNSSGINDGAAAVVLMSEQKALELGVPIMAEIKGIGQAGVDPSIMGFSPVMAIKEAVNKTNIHLDQIDLFEINESFAAQMIAVAQGLREEGVGEVPFEKLNVNGGSIALGSPVGSSGCRILVTLLHEMKRSKKRTGLAAICAGGGIGTAIITQNYAA